MLLAVWHGSTDVRWLDDVSPCATMSGTFLILNNIVLITWWSDITLGTDIYLPNRTDWWLPDALPVIRHPSHQLEQRHVEAM